MDKKKKLIIGTSAVAGMALLGGTFAFFYDEVSSKLNNTVGTVAMTGHADMSHTQADRAEIENLQSSNSALNESADAHAGLDSTALESLKTSFNAKFEQAANNLNPGDNDYIPPKKTQTETIIARPGTDHEINIDINNTGTKSIKNRVIVEVTGVKNGKALTLEQLKNVKVCFDLKNTAPGVSSMHVNNMDLLKEIPYNENKSGANMIAFVFDEEFLRNCQFDKVSPVVSDEFDDVIKSGLVLSGTGDNAEVEKFVSGVDGSNKVYKNAPTSGHFKLDVGIRQAVNKTVGIDGAELTFTIKLQSMQNRNTGNANWDTVFSTQVVANVE